MYCFKLYHTIIQICIQKLSERLPKSFGLLGARNTGYTHYLALYAFRLMVDKSIAYKHYNFPSI
jgi:hypothetical protein